MAANKNVDLSLQHIKRYLEAFEQLPAEVKAGDFGKKKENAEAAWDYLNYFLNSKITDVYSLSICGPRPKIPDLI